MTESNLVAGYTAQDHLLIDLDDTDSWKAEKIALMTMEEWPAVGHCLVMESSPSHHHLVYDAWLPWDSIEGIIHTLGGLQVVEPNFVAVRHFRHDLTLRISGKNYTEHRTEPPRVVQLLANRYHPNGSYGIRKYLRALSTFNPKAETWLNHSLLNPPRPRTVQLTLFIRGLPGVSP